MHSNSLSSAIEHLDAIVGEDAPFSKGNYTPTLYFLVKGAYIHPIMK